MFTQGIRTINELAADVTVNNSTVFVPVPGFTFSIRAGVHYKWAIRGVMSLGGASGFKFTTGLPAFPTPPPLYNAEWVATSVVAAQFATPSDFFDAALGAGDYFFFSGGVVTASAGSPLTFSLQFAQQVAVAFPSVLHKGMTLELVQYTP